MWQWMLDRIAIVVDLNNKQSQWNISAILYAAGLFCWSTALGIYSTYLSIVGGTLVYPVDARFIFGGAVFFAVVGIFMFGLLVASIIFFWKHQGKDPTEQRLDRIIQLLDRSQRKDDADLHQ